MDHEKKELYFRGPLVFIKCNIYLLKKKMYTNSTFTVPKLFNFKFFLKVRQFLTLKLLLGISYVTEKNIIVIEKRFFYMIFLVSFRVLLLS